MYLVGCQKDKYKIQYKKTTQVRSSWKRSERCIYCIRRIEMQAIKHSLFASYSTNAIRINSSYCELNLSVLCYVLEHNPSIYTMKKLTLNFHTYSYNVWFFSVWFRQLCFGVVGSQEVWWRGMGSHQVGTRIKIMSTSGFIL